MKTAASSRNPWPIAIVTYFIVFVTFIVTFIIWALGHKQDLVTENYYDLEVRYQEQLDRLNRTRPFAAQTTVRFDAPRNCIVVTLPATQAAAATGRIHLYRPSNARLDREVPLAINAAGEQTLDARALAAGLWKVRVEWSVDGQEYYFDQAVIVLGAPDSPPATAVQSSSSVLKPPARTSATRNAPKPGPAQL